jgi:KDO2-lipid IV(A) lauroyltransferase
VLILSGHFGNWEVTLATFGVFGFPLGVVVREMDNPYLHRWFAQFRERYRHRQLMKDGGWEEIVAALRAGGNLGLLADQDAGRRGVFVDFFGAPASTHKSIALLALEYDALIVLGYGIRLPDALQDARWSRFEIGCEAVLDPRDLQTSNPVRELTQQFTHALERAIGRAPEQYFWVHRRWKTDGETRKKAEKRADKAGERRAA